MAKEARIIIMNRLRAAIITATTADLQRAAEFLEFAYSVRRGCTERRRTGRLRQAQGERGDAPMSW